MWLFRKCPPCPTLTGLVALLFFFFYFGSLRCLICKYKFLVIVYQICIPILEHLQLVEIVSQVLEIWENMSFERNAIKIYIKWIFLTTQQKQFLIYRLLITQRQKQVGFIKVNKWAIQIFTNQNFGILA